MWQKLSETTDSFRRYLTEGWRRLVRLYHPATLRERGMLWSLLLAAVTLLLLLLATALYWSGEPERFDTVARAESEASESGRPVVSGYTTTVALIGTIETLLYKPGGFLRNDRLPPGVFLDNIPSWEFGVLQQARDLVRSLRNDMSRSQSQSREDEDLAEADSRLHFDANAWLFPSSEGEFKQSLRALRRYLQRLNDQKQQEAQFYTRADNLSAWLALVEKRLGSLSQRLSASVGQQRLNTDLAGDSEATASTARPTEFEVKTSWFELDDVFYEARGATWALLHFLKAIERDFKSVLEKKNAVVSLRQIIRELEQTQQTLWSPMVMNGSGFGLVANHSLVMASYISRANAALIDLRGLLSQG